ncbi:MAG: YceI family protein [Sediminibacterium sp.]|nr:YceI family protein [Sediminibacterium sp.]
MRYFAVILHIVMFVTSQFTGNAQDLHPVSEQSTIQFRIKNMGIHTSGTLSGLRGTIQFDENLLSNSFCKVTVDVNTIDTRSKGRDNHIKKSDFFDVVSFPIISFQSTQITALSEKIGYRMQGILTIKGVSKPISFLFQAKKEKLGYRFTGEMLINRLDFGVGESSWILSSPVTVQLNILANQ